MHESMSDKKKGWNYTISHKYINKSHKKCTFFQYSGWQISNKDNYIAVQVTFKVQSRQETIVELHFDPTQHQEVVK